MSFLRGSGVLPLLGNMHGSGVYGRRRSSRRALLRTVRRHGSALLGLHTVRGHRTPLLRLRTVRGHGMSLHTRLRGHGAAVIGLLRISGRGGRSACTGNKAFGHQRLTHSAAAEKSLSRHARAFCNGNPTPRSRARDTMLEKSFDKKRVGCYDFLAFTLGV